MNNADRQVSIKLLEISTYDMFLRTRPGLRISLPDVALRSMQHFNYSATVSTEAQTPTGSSQNEDTKTESTKNKSKKGRRDVQKKATKLRRSTSPEYAPRTASPEKDVYVLTLNTNKAYHDRLTALRKKYFPQELNKVAAHLTLFHALPGSRMEDCIIPRLQEIAAETSQFKIYAGSPFRLKRGIAISVPQHEGGTEAQAIHHALQKSWLEEGFLSEQDADECRLHFTIMNKVDDEKVVNEAFEEVSQEWKGDWGTANGLILWRYYRGFWRWKETFSFKPEQQQ